jgi:hypothetical protein
LPLLTFLSESGNQTAQRPRAERPQHNSSLPPEGPPLAHFPPPATAYGTRSRPLRNPAGGKPLGLGNQNHPGLGRSLLLFPRPPVFWTKFGGWVHPDPGNLLPQTHD